jgi:glycosyltransferase involved in cell wall biosynthesis
MRIIFDARWIFEKPSGIGVYSTELIRRLSSILPEVHFIVLFSSKEIAERTLPTLPQNIECCIVKHKPTSIKSQLFMPRIIKKLKADIYFSPNYLIPYFAFTGPFKSKTKCVTTIHDIIPLIVTDYAPDSKTSRMLKLYKYCIGLTVKLSKHILVDSNSTKCDIIEQVKPSDTDAKKIKTVYIGVPERTAKPIMHEAVINDLTDTKRVRQLLYVGRLDPYKNVPLLIEAANEAKKQLPFPIKVVIAGPEDERYPEARDVAAQSFYIHTEFTGFISDEALCKLYADSDVLVHPSIYEGFGLPVVEAMRIGLPVICTDGGSLPEVAGEACRVVPTSNLEALTEAIVETLSYPEACTEMSKRGIEQAMKFNWEKAAQETKDYLLA